MPRKQRAALEVAVAASPLFKLALEIRIMIYEFLLIQEGGISISSAMFKRKRNEKPIYHKCLHCGIVYASDHDCMHHTTNYSTHHFYPRQPRIPKITTSLLQTCRLIRFEARPILYSKNNFHFSDSAAASNFRWTSDSAHAGAIQEIEIDVIFNEPWMAYFTARTLSFGQDFPHLRRMSIDLIDIHWWNIEEFIRPMSERLMKTCLRLDWLLVLLSDGCYEVLDYFEPLVNRKDDSQNGKKEVQRHVWANERGNWWKNALLWRGVPGEAPPQKFNMIKDQPL